MTTPSSVPGAQAPAAKSDVVFTITALAVLFLTVVPVGTAVFYLGFVRGDSPCIMCWEQRIGMLLVSLVGLFVLRYGPKPKYVGMAILIAAWGLLMGLRHVGMHGARDVGQGFSLEIMGAHTYTWALFTYWVCVIAMGALLLMVRPAHLNAGVRSLNGLERITGWAFIVVVAANVVQAFASTGPPPFIGQSDPLRFSFNTKYWYWSLEEWKPPLALNFRGRWAVDKPDVAQLPTDPAAGPFGSLPAIAIKEHRSLALTFNGVPTDLAYDAATDQFLVTTDDGVYLADAALAQITRHTVVDAGFSVDLGHFVGAAFLNKGELIAVGENKSYVVLKPNDKANADSNYRYFLESRDQFDEVTRSRFGTVRARMFYIMSAAYDPATNSVYTLTVPNNVAKRLVVSRFDRKDLTLSAEYVPTIAENACLTPFAKRTINEFSITGATIKDGLLYAISAAYSTLLAFDLQSHELIAAYAVPSLSRPVGIAVKGDDLYILSADRALTVIARPNVATSTQQKPMCLAEEKP
jgi:disulfide bond formation protein DsbB